MAKSLRDQLKAFVQDGELPSEKKRKQDERSESASERTLKSKNTVEKPVRTKIDPSKKARDVKEKRPYPKKDEGKKVRAGNVPGSNPKPKPNSKRKSKRRSKNLIGSGGPSMAAIREAFGSNKPSRQEGSTKQARIPEIRFADPNPIFWAPQKRECNIRYPQANGVSETLDWNGADENVEQITLGFDFGTSAVKAMAQLSDGSVIPIEFDNGLENSFVLPTRIYKVADSFRLEGRNNSKCYKNLKLDLINQPNDPESKIQVAAFVALALRLVRGCLYDNLAQVLQGKLIIWDINFGVPASLHGDEIKKKAFEDVFRLACFASTQSSASDGFSLGEKQLIYWMQERAWEGASERGELLHTIGVVPEIAAQIYGVKKSETWDPSTRFMSVVDIGAGTVDLGFFSLTDKSEQINFLKTDVRENGAVIFHRNRIQTLLETFSTRLKNHKSYFESLLEMSDINEQLPEDYTGYVSGMSVKHVDNPDDLFAKNKLNKQLLSVAQETKAKRYPNPMDWQNVPVLLCGGGAAEPIYSRYYERNLAKDGRSIGYKLKKLVRPRKVRDSGVQDEVYKRLSLAYGLSFPELRSIKLVEEKDISDITLKVDQQELPSMISKDDV